MSKKIYVKQAKKYPHSHLVVMVGDKVDSIHYNHSNAYNRAAYLRLQNER